MAKQQNVDGFYTAYLTGIAGQSIGMFVFKDRIVAGADAGGGIYDGTYVVSDDGASIVADIRFVMRGGLSITGAMSAGEPLTAQMKIELPSDIQPHRTHRLETPLGPVNAKFEKIRGV